MRRQIHALAERQQVSREGSRLPTTAVVRLVHPLLSEPDEYGSDRLAGVVLDIDRQGHLFLAGVAVFRERCLRIHRVCMKCSVKHLQSQRGNRFRHSIRDCRRGWCAPGSLPLALHSSRQYWRRGTGSGLRRRHATGDPPSPCTSSRSLRSGLKQCDASET